jgi:hypothetical protein
MKTPPPTTPKQCGYVPGRKLPPHDLAAIIRNAWAKCGAYPEVVVEDGVVRSDMVRGLPG